MFSQALDIVKLSFKLEWRKKQSFLSVLIYVLTTSYLCFLVYNETINPEAWNTLFWVVFLFAAIQAAFRSFQNEADRRFLLYYGMVKPQALILGKTIYNFIYLLIIGLFSTAIFLLLLGNIITDILPFTILLIVGAAGFSGILTFTSGIAAKAGNNPALPAILSIPLLYPQILTLSRTSIRAITGFSWTINAPYLIVIGLLALVSALLSYVLFTYLWRD